MNHQAKILVISDDVQFRMLLRETLELEDFATIGAEDGLVGVQLAQDQRPDLILCKLVLPKLDGYGVLSALRGDTATAAIPIVLMTTKVDSKVEELGLENVLVSPVDREDILLAVNYHLGLRDS